MASLREIVPYYMRLATFFGMHPGSNVRHVAVRPYRLRGSRVAA